MSEAASKKKHKLGETVEVKDGATVVRPDGNSVTVSGDFYVLTQTGVYDLDGTKLTVG